MVKMIWSSGSAHGRNPICILLIKTEPHGWNSVIFRKDALPFQLHPPPTPPSMKPKAAIPFIHLMGKFTLEIIPYFYIVEYDFILYLKPLNALKIAFFVIALLTSTLHFRQSGVYFSLTNQYINSLKVSIGFTHLLPEVFSGETWVHLQAKIFYLYEPHISILPGCIKN